MPPLPRLLRLIFLLLLTPVLLLLGCQSKLIYHPKPYGEADRQLLATYDGKPLSYMTGQGKQVAHYIPPRDGSQVPKTIWICFSGNGSLALNWLYQVEDWSPGFAYLLVDYPGYGDCEGTPSPARIRESSLKAVEALTRHLRESPETLKPRLRVLGHSIGCAAGLMAADDLGAQKVVLIAPFTTLTEMGKRLLGWPLCYVNMHRFDNRKHLAAAVAQGAEVVIFHGTHDEVIPVAMSRELAAAHPEKVTLHEMNGQNHNGILGNVSQEIGAAMSDR